ncbi:MAG TPA: hypothetical protein VJH63_00165 [Candidatus Paceibacterota bacterium]
MKKTKIIVIVLLTLILISFVASYVESSYCHSFATQPPPGLKIRTVEESKEFLKEYYPSPKFCNLNAYATIPAIMIRSLPRAVLSGFNM